MNRINYILAKCYQGQKIKGVELGPNILSKFLGYGKTSIITELFDTDEGYKQIKNKVTESLRNNYTPITIGGDHSVSIGSVSGALDYYKNDLTLVWVDAHADINTKLSSNSGSLHGMPISYLTGLSKPLFNDFNKRLSLKNIVYLGIRDVDRYESLIIDNYSIKYLTSKDLADTKLLDTIKIDTNNIHMSIDVDVLDPEYMTSTGTSVHNGISMNTLETIINWIKKQGNVVSADLVEFNPLIGTLEEVNISLESCRKIIDILEDKQIP